MTAGMRWRRERMEANVPQMTCRFRVFKDFLGFRV
jgi:hypothetical protein